VNLKRFITISALIFAAMTARTAVAAPSGGSEWQWLRVEPKLPLDAESWDVLKGVTELSLHGQHFRALLTYEDKQSLRNYAIDGYIRGTEIIANETQLNTDASPRHYRGIYEHVGAKGSTPGFDRIVLTSGAFYIGISRTIIGVAN
jgi:hypothetical protein